MVGTVIVVGEEEGVGGEGARIRRRVVSDLN